ncbi:hypothetical protein M422DRAFT_67826 [Sphaerobolus stellatus SS14]|uniref:Uncharacterized protein n=1 Tax=Sphaerobolus stellatus (strain SS14) TaxID=990650 RepID=A0A0C9VAF9_SPHS4|nr:hypothetical protein M422DRAFT_67826 [Sphaerobolus stellatus SS14]
MMILAEIIHAIPAFTKELVIPIFKTSKRVVIDNYTIEGDLSKAANSWVKGGSVLSTHGPYLDDTVRGSLETGKDRCQRWRDSTYEAIVDIYLEKRPKGKNRIAHWRQHRHRIGGVKDSSREFERQCITSATGVTSQYDKFVTACLIAGVNVPARHADEQFYGTSKARSLQPLDQTSSAFSVALDPPPPRDTDVTKAFRYWIKTGKVTKLGQTPELDDNIGESSSSETDPGTTVIENGQTALVFPERTHWLAEDLLHGEEENITAIWAEGLSPLPEVEEPASPTKAIASGNTSRSPYIHDIPKRRDSAPVIIAV